MNEREDRLGVVLAQVFLFDFDPTAVLKFK